MAERVTPNVDSLAEVAATLRGLLAEVAEGRLTAGPGLLARLEGAVLAVEALARPVRSDSDPVRREPDAPVSGSSGRREA